MEEINNFKGPITILKIVGKEEFLDKDGFDVFFLKDLMDLLPNKEDAISAIPILPVITNVYKYNESRSSFIKRLKETSTVYSKFFNEIMEKNPNALIPLIQSGDNLIEDVLDIRTSKG